LKVHRPIGPVIACLVTQQGALARYMQFVLQLKAVDCAKLSLYISLAFEHEGSTVLSETPAI